MFAVNLKIQVLMNLFVFMLMPDHSPLITILSVVVVVEWFLKIVLIVPGTVIW